MCSFERRCEPDGRAAQDIPTFTQESDGEQSKSPANEWQLRPEDSRSYYWDQRRELERQDAEKERVKAEGADDKAERADDEGHSDESTGEGADQVGGDENESVLSSLSSLSSSSIPRSKSVGAVPFSGGGRS